MFGGCIDLCLGSSAGGFCVDLCEWRMSVRAAVRGCVFWGLLCMLFVLCFEVCDGSMWSAQEWQFDQGIHHVCSLLDTTWSMQISC